MSDMVERVRRALQRDIDANCAVRLTEGMCRELARVAIAAMREPTPEMVERAASTLMRENGGVEYAPSVGWRAMIDEALRPPLPLQPPPQP